MYPVFIISLERERFRRQRLIYNNLNVFPDAKIVNAIDGLKHVDLPKRYAGAIGCTATHLQIYRHCIDYGFKKVLILEDDAFVPVEKKDAILSAMHQIEIEMVNFTKAAVSAHRNNGRNFMCTAAFSTTFERMSEFLDLREKLLTNQQRTLQIDVQWEGFLKRVDPFELTYARVPYVEHQSRCKPKARIKSCTWMRATGKIERVGEIWHQRATEISKSKIEFVS